MTSGTLGDSLDLAAFRRLYPDEFFEKFYSQGVRPDGRPLGRCRSTSVVLGAVPIADGSALVKIGNTAMLAAVKVEVMTPKSDSPTKGQLVIEFQMPPLCSPHLRPGKPSEESFHVNQQLANIISSSGLVDEEQLGIQLKRSAWKAYLDVCCLDADGSLLDAALLASVAALADLKLPAVIVSRHGHIIRQKGEGEGQEGEGQEGEGKEGEGQKGEGKEGEREEEEKDEEMNGGEGGRDIKKKSKRLKLGPIPVSLTIALYKKYLLSDPSSEEERIADCSISVAFTGGRGREGEGARVQERVGEREGEGEGEGEEGERLVCLQKAGGSENATTATLLDCMAVARLRVKEVQKILKNVFEEDEILEET